MLNIRNNAILTATLLARIMPNYGGPKSQIRKLINSIVYCQLVYANPTVTTSKNLKYNIRVIQKPQRVSALRIIVLAGLPPIELLTLEREEI